MKNGNSLPPDPTYKDEGPAVLHGLALHVGVTLGEHVHALLLLLRNILGLFPLLAPAGHFRFGGCQRVNHNFSFTLAGTLSLVVKREGEITTWTLVPRRRH